MPPLPADFIRHRVCKPICEKFLTLPPFVSGLMPSPREGNAREPCLNHAFAIVSSCVRPSGEKNSPHSRFSQPQRLIISWRPIITPVLFFACPLEICSLNHTVLRIPGDAPAAQRTCRALSADAL